MDKPKIAGRKLIKVEVKKAITVCNLPNNSFGEIRNEIRFFFEKE